MTRVRERRFQITLWTCEDDFSKEKEYICELYSCQLNFQISSIPQATIKPLFGTIINSPEDAQKQSTSFEKLLSLAKDRSAVRIVLKVTQSFFDNNAVDSYEWPFSGTGDPDEYGQYNSKPITIFEGFICPPSAEVTAVSAGITLTIQHWLSSLANVSLLTTACHTSNPMELALQCYDTLALTSSNNKAKWMEVSPQVNSSKGLWKYGIKELFLRVLKEGDKAKTLNRFADRQRKRIKTALNRINGDALKFRDITAGDTALNFLLDLHFHSEVYQTFIHTSAWDKLVGYYASNFLFCLSPRVTNALLIPTPCAIDPSKVIELKDDDILQISSSPLATSQLSRLYCVATMGENKSAADDGRTSLFPAAWYPEYEDEDKLQDGYIQSIAYPEWLTSEFPYTIPKVSDMLTMFAPLSKLRELRETAKRNAKDAGKKKTSVRKELGRAFAQVSYLIQAFNSTWACVVTPGRMDISIGAAVHCKVHGETSTALDLYGTVTGEIIRFVSGKSTPTTQLTLTNIRTNKTIKDEINNPSTRPLGYYEKEWDGTKVKLYD